MVVTGERNCCYHHFLDIGLIYLRSRYYDPTTSRFITKDSFAGFISDPRSLNRYAYAYNNPVNLIDPSGHSPLEKKVNSLLDKLQGGLDIAGFRDRARNFNRRVTYEWTKISLSGFSVLVVAADIYDYTSLGSNGILGSVANGMSKAKYARYMGKLGEDAAGIAKNTRRIESITGKAKYRIPDGLDEISQVLIEVKNVKKQGYTSQIKDFLLWSQENGYDFVLKTRSGTKISKPLQELIDSGEIIHQFIK